MNRKSIMMSVIALLTVFVSCRENTQEKVKTFATDIANMVSKNQVDSLKMYYEDAASFDSISISFNADDMIVEESGNANEFLVRLGNDADLSVAIDSDGKMKVISSHGLLAFNKSTMDFAKKTGQWKDGITDGELAKRMNDRDFETFLIQKAEKEFAGWISIVHTVPSADFDASERKSIYTLKNNSSKQIDGSDYAISIPFFKEAYFGDANPKRWEETREGKNIPPKGSVSYVEYIITERGEFSRTGPVFDGHKIIFKIKGKDIFNKYFEANGDEYEKYIKEK